MTGYAANQVQINSATIQLEIKSVNHRFLDITIKSAEEFKPLENQLRTLIAQYINRGKIDIKLKITLLIVSALQIKIGRWLV